MRKILENDIIAQNPNGPAHRNDYFHEKRLIDLSFDTFQNHQDVIGAWYVNI